MKIVYLPDLLPAAGNINGNGIPPVSTHIRRLCSLFPSQNHSSSQIQTHTKPDDTQRRDFEGVDMSRRAVYALGDGRLPRAGKQSIRHVEVVDCGVDEYKHE